MVAGFYVSTITVKMAFVSDFVLLILHWGAVNGVCSGVLLMGELECRSRERRSHLIVVSRC